MIGGIQENGELAGSEYVQQFQNYETHIRIASTVSAFKDVANLAKEQSKDQIECLISYQYVMLEAGNERQFTVTESSRLRWIPEWVQTGDRVAIIYGYRFPVVIRRHEDRLWTYVSLCYIDGVMFGEAMKDEGYPTVDITLY